MPAVTRLAVYLWVVSGLGLAAVANAAVSIRWYPIDPRWIALCALTLFGGIATLKMRAAPISFSISDAFTFTTLLLLGPAPATITASLEAFVLSCFLSPGQRRVRRIVFNVAAVGLAMWAAGRVLVALEGGRGAGSLVEEPARLAFATAAAVGTYFLVNTWTVALAVAFEQNQPGWLTWRTHFLNLGFAYAAGAYTALLLTLFAPTIGLPAFLLLAPMPLVFYASVRIWLGRVNDRVTYLDTVNRQYRATIEAFAHAVDAKDRVTHGHIRRVQSLSLEVARALGCVDEGELHAMEAASLLHDVGKLAIPEHILNKPGRLTDAEYARMKEHAHIGAEILASVEFPYQVVPIVRHHHENWDGSGYPDGLSGTHIPLGARILAVVDCFDALTSDRPYRRAMSSTDAVAVLRARSGTMYDPTIVEHFMSRVGSIEPPAPVAAATATPTQHERSAAPIDPVLTWTDADRYPLLVAIAAPVLGVARRTAGAAAGAVFAYVGSKDALAPVAALGLDARMIEALHMRLGERLSGWVGATRQIVRESDGRLDLPGFETAFRAAVSLPITRGGTLLGVMTLYGESSGCFDGIAMEPLHLLVSAIAEAPVAGMPVSTFVSTTST